MAVTTTDLYVRPEDGWVLAATAPAAYVLIKPENFFPGWVAVAASSPPVAATRATNTVVFGGVPLAAETVTIGGAAKDSEFYSRFLIGGYRSGGSRRVNISLTPRIMEVGPARAPAGPPPNGSQIPQTIRVWGEDRTIPPNRP